MEDTGQEEEFREDRGEGDESREDLGSSEEHNGSEGEDYVDLPPSLQQTDSVGCSSSLAPQADEAPVPRETQNTCVVRLTDKDTEQDNDEKHQLTLQLAKTRPHRQTARKRISITIKSEYDGHEDDDDDYDPNEDVGASSDDAGGDDDVDKNTNGEATASRGRYSCAICDRSFHRAYRLKRHSRTHTGEKPFQCADCGKNFSQTYDLRNHRRRAHGQDDLYPCPHCVECFLTNTELRTHRALHSQERRKEAGCQKKQQREMERDRMRFFSCKQKEGQTVSSFITELRALASGCGFGDEQETRIRDRILCGVIDKLVLRNTIRDETQLTLQLVEEKALATEKAKTDPRLHKAKKSINSQSEADHHNEDGGGSSDDAPGGDNGEVTTSRGRHYCAICDRSFRRMYELKRHSRTHTGEKPFHCADCGKNFSQTYHLRRHRRNFHDEDNLYPCPGGAEVKTDEAPNPRETQSPCVRLTDKDTEQDDDETQQQLTLQLVEEKALVTEKAETDPHRHTTRKMINIQLKPDPHNEDGGGSNDDAGKNANGEVTASRGRHYCAICDRSFRRAYGLERHSRTHTGEKPFRCADCGKTFSQTYDLRNHRRRTHGQDDLYPCPDGAESKESASRRRLSCAICERTFQTMYRLKRHSRTHTGERPFRCTHCDKTYSQIYSLRVHMKMHQEKPYRCPDCNLSFRDEAALMKHQQEKKRSKERVEKKKPYPCSRCDEGFSSLAELTSHMPVHQGEEPQICPDCGRSFQNPRKFQRHRELHLTVTKHLCNECGKYMPSAASLKQHLLVHSGAKPHLCSLCGQSYSKPYYLKCHMRVHAGITQKRHSCLDCGRTFSRMYDVRRHQMTHTGQKPFRCLYCGKSFLRQSQVKIHMRIHTGEKPYTCLACGKSFTQSGDRNRHESRCHRGATLKKKKKKRPELLGEDSPAIHEEDLVTSNTLTTKTCTP